MSFNLSPTISLTSIVSLMNFFLLMNFFFSLFYHFHFCNNAVWFFYRIFYNKVCKYIFTFFNRWLLLVYILQVGSLIKLGGWRIIWGLHPPERKSLEEGFVGQCLIPWPSPNGPHRNGKSESVFIDENCIHEEVRIDSGNACKMIFYDGVIPQGKMSYSHYKDRRMSWRSVMVGWNWNFILTLEINISSPPHFFPNLHGLALYYFPEWKK